MSEKEKLEMISEAVIFAAPGQITPEALINRTIEYFGAEGYNEDSVTDLAGGTIGALFMLARMVKDLQFQVQELEAKVASK